MCKRCDDLEADVVEQVLLAAAERELILAEADSGESVPHAKRPLSAAERKARMRFGEIEALEQAAADKIAKLLDGNRQLYILSVIGEIFGARDRASSAQVIDAFERISRAQPKAVAAEIARAAKDIETILEQVYTGASLIAVGEAARQGVDHLPGALDPEPGRFHDQARMVALHPWTRLTSKLQADMLTPAALAKPVTKADVQKALEAIPLDGAKDLGRQAINSAHGAGRHDTIAPMEPREIYASELLDGETCDRCEAVDGKQYASMADALVEYEQGYYGACRGGSRCRGTLVSIY